MNSCIDPSNVLSVPGWAEIGTREGVEPATTNSQGHLRSLSATALRGATATSGATRVEKLLLSCLQAAASPGSMSVIACLHQPFDFVPYLVIHNHSVSWSYWRRSGS